MPPRIFVLASLCAFARALLVGNGAGGLAGALAGGLALAAPALLRGLLEVCPHKGFDMLHLFTRFA